MTRWLRPCTEATHPAPTSSELTKWKNSLQSGAVGCSTRGLPMRTDGGRTSRILGEKTVHPRSRGRDSVYSPQCPHLGPCAEHLGPTVHTLNVLPNT